MLKIWAKKMARVGKKRETSERATAVITKKITSDAIREATHFLSKGHNRNNEVWGRHHCASEKKGIGFFA